MTATYERIYGDPTEDEFAYPQMGVGIRRDGFRWAVDLLEYRTVGDRNRQTPTVLETTGARNREAAAEVARGLVGV